jgi:transposase
VLRQWDRRDRLSTISALSVSPHRRRLGLYWAVQRANVRAPAVLQFLRALRRHFPHGFTLIWDRARPHRAACVREWVTRQAAAVVVEWLPPYAPDLNPVEPLWSHTKYGDLANFTPDDLDALEAAVTGSLTATHGVQRLLRAFFAAAELKL